MTNPMDDGGRLSRLGLIHITTVPMSLTFLRGQATYMREAGFRVGAISSPGKDLSAFGRDERVPVEAVRMHRRVTPFRDLLSLARLTWLLRRNRPTIVHAHTPKAGLLGMIAARLNGSPVRIYHMRGLPLLAATGMKRRLLWCSEWLACRLAHRVLCVSHSIRTVALREGVCAADKIKVLAGGSGNGVDAVHRFSPSRVVGERQRVRESLGIPRTDTVIGFVGRVVKDKGIVELAAAWRGVREEHPSTHLVIVGPLEPQDPVPPEIEAGLRSDPRVHLMGMDWNTPPLYAAMDVVVLPTYREGFPNVPLEAAAMELPVVASRVPGCTDAIKHGETGVLVPVRDAEALKRAISTYLDDPALRRRHGQRARQRVLEDFSQDVLWSALADEYRSLVDLRDVEINRRRYRRMSA